VATVRLGRQTTEQGKQIMKHGSRTAATSFLQKGPQLGKHGLAHVDPSPPVLYTTQAHECLLFHVYHDLALLEHKNPPKKSLDNARARLLRPTFFLLTKTKMIVNKLDLISDGLL